MNICKFCSHWTESKDAGIGICDNPKLDELLGLNGTVPHPRLRTHFEFGCIHFEMKNWQPTKDEEERMGE